MHRSLAKAPLLAIALALTLALSACGGEDAELLPGQTARQITANLDTVQQLADEGDCFGAESAAQQVSEQIETLEVDQELLTALEKGSTRLGEVIEACEEVTTEGLEPAIPSEDEEAEEGEEESGDGEGNRRRKQPQGEQGKSARPAPKPSTPTTPSRPQQPEGGGEGKGNEGGEPGGGEEGGGEEPSGGVAPASPANGGE